MGKAAIGAASERNDGVRRVRRGIDDGMLAEEFCSNTGSPSVRCTLRRGNR